MIDTDRVDGEKESSVSEQTLGPQERSTKNPVLIIKGCADVGKLLLLEQAKRNCSAEKENSTECKTAFFTFQNTLASLAAQQLETDKMRRGNLVISTVRFYLQKVYAVLIKTGNLKTHRFPNQQLNGRNDTKDRTVLIHQILRAHREKYGKHRLQELEPGFWLEEFRWMKQMNVWMGESEAYRSLSRQNRGSSVFMSRMDQIAAYQLFEMYCHALEARGEADWEDVPLLVIRNAAAIPENMKFDCVLVDEAQDLSLAELTALSALYKKDMMAVLDKKQRIYEKIWEPEQLRIPWTERTLTQPLRTTRQIAALAESICRKDLSGEELSKEPGLPQREGSVPRLVHLKDRTAERRYIINLVKEYQKRNPNLTIGIITAGKQQADLCSSWLSEEGLEHERLQKDAAYSVKTAGIKVMTAFAAKGLEFHCVILPMFEEGNYPLSFVSGDKEKLRQFEIRMRNLLYVSMTRARNLLTITWSGWGGSRFLQEMDPALYRLEGLPMEPADCFEMEENLGGTPDRRLGRAGGADAAMERNREYTREFRESAGQQTVDSGRKVRVGFVQYHSQSKPDSVQTQGTCMQSETYVRQRQENGPQERAAQAKTSAGHGKVPYCQGNGSQEAAQIRNMEAVQWLEKISGAEKGKYAGIQAGDALRQVVSGYAAWCKTRDSVFESGTKEEREWMALIWPQFVTSVAEQHLEVFEIDQNRRMQYLSLFLEKVFHLFSAISASEHAKRMQEARYRRYFSESFYPDRQADFWKWLRSGKAGNESIAALGRFLDCQMHLENWLSMYLFFLIQPQTDEWMEQETEKRNRIRQLKTQIEREDRTGRDKNQWGSADVFLLKVLAMGTLPDELCRKLWNLADQLEAAGVVLGEYEESRTDERAEKRPETAGQKNVAAENLQLYLQEEVLQLRQLLEKNVPELLRLLLEYQKYQKSEINIGSLPYQEKSGALYQKISVLLENLGIAMEKNVYQIRRKQESILHAQADAISEMLDLDEKSQRQPFTRQELAERADVESCIESFEAILNGILPQSMREAVDRVILDLKSFEKLTDALPDEKKKLRRYLRIYVPEVVEMLVSYQQYRRGGLDKESMDELKAEIQRALESFDTALKEKQKMISSMETMCTAAQAETLKGLLDAEG